ncbi:MAG: hypothetical protein JNG86_20180 [Verrucomicrobiaceae bacterium]|nr:hypothetical protein [Verrucomicrobiaceae bacterium]
MKREDHFVQFVFAGLSGAISGALSLDLSSMTGPPYDSETVLWPFLLADVLCGLSILLIISCLRRGYRAVKIGALLVCWLPLLHLYYSTQRFGQVICESTQR